MRYLRCAVIASLCLSLTLSAFPQSHKKSASKKTSHAAAASAKPTLEQAQKFIDDAEKQLSDLADKTQKADWVNENFITDDTDAIATDMNSENSAVTTKLALDAKKYDSVTLPAVYERKLHLLKLQLTAADSERPRFTEGREQAQDRHAEHLRQGEILSDFEAGHLL